MKFTDLYIFLMCLCFFALISASAYADSVLGYNINCSKNYTFCDTFDSATINLSRWMTNGGCNNTGGMMWCPDIASGNDANSHQWSYANKTLTSAQPFCLDYVVNYSQIGSTELQYIGFNPMGYGTANATWAEMNAGGNNGYDICATADTSCTPICGSVAAGQKVHIQLCYMGSSGILEGTCYNATTNIKINAVNKTHAGTIPPNSGFWALDWQGATDYDYMIAWNGYSTDAPYITAVPPAAFITNTSFAVTNTQNLISNSTAWNNYAYVNLSSNLLSFIFTTSVSVNASCSIYDFTNYSTATANNSNYKLSTTQATSHSYTLFDNLTPYLNQCVFCQYYNGSLTASSGCLKTMYAPVLAPTYNSISDNSTAVTPNGTDTIRFSINVSDDILVSNVIAAWNMTGSWVNFSFTPVNLKSSNVSISQAISYRNNDTIGYRFMINDSFGNWNYTGINTFMARNISSYQTLLPPYCSQLISGGMYRGENVSVTLSANSYANFNWVMFIWKGTPVYNHSITGLTLDITDSALNNYPLNTDVDYGYNFSDMKGNTGSCRNDALSTDRPASPLMELGVCPSTTPQLIFILSVFVFAVLLIIFGVFGASVIGIFGGLVLIIIAFSITACNGLIGIIMWVVAILIMIGFVMKMVGGK